MEIPAPNQPEARKVEKILDFGPQPNWFKIQALMYYHNMVARHTAYPSDGTVCTKGSDATVAALVAAITQRIRRKCHRHGSEGNKRRPSPSSFPLPELAVAVALPLGCHCLRLCRLGRLGDEWTAVAIVRCPHLSPSSHHRCQGQPHHCRPAARNLYCYTATVLLLVLVVVLILVLLIVASLLL